MQARRNKLYDKFGFSKKKKVYDKFVLLLNHMESFLKKKTGDTLP